MITCKVRGDDVEVTSDIIEYVYKNVGKLKYLLTERTNAVAHVNLLGMPDNKIKAEVTITLPYFVISGEDVTRDVYSSIDGAIEQIKERVNLYSDQVNDELQRNGHLPVFYESTEINPVEFKIVRKKRVKLEKTDAEDAILQMNLMGHDYFIYEDEDGGTNIVYKRKDGNYGVIKAEDEDA